MINILINDTEPLIIRSIYSDNIIIKVNSGIFSLCQYRLESEGIHRYRPPTSFRFRPQYLPPSNAQIAGVWPGSAGNLPVESNLLADNALGAYCSPLTGAAVMVSDANRLVSMLFNQLFAPFHPWGTRSFRFSFGAMHSGASPIPAGISIDLLF